MITGKLARRQRHRTKLKEIYKKQKQVKIRTSQGIKLLSKKASKNYL